MTERIDHALEAQKRIDWANAQQEEEGQFEFSVRDNAILAQAEATLALVEQQRIANLIALVALSGNENVQESSFDEGSTLSSAGMHALIEYVRTPATPFSDPDDAPEVRAGIREALGL